MIYTIYENQISLFYKDCPYNIPKDDFRFEKIKECLLRNDFEAAADLIEFDRYFSSNSGLAFKDNVLYYQGEKLPVTLSDLIIQARMKNNPFEHYLKFFTALKYNKDFLDNPNKRKMFYRKFKNVYVLNDFVIYDAEERLPIDNFYDFRDLPNYFQAELVQTSSVTGAINKAAGFKSDRLVKIFTEEVFKKNLDNSFIDWITLLNGLTDPNVLYEEWGSIKANFLVAYPQSLNVFLKRYKSSQKAVINFIKNSDKNSLNRLSAMVFNNNDLELTYPDFSSAQELIPVMQREISRERGSLFFLHLEEHFPLLKNLETKVDEFEIVVPQHNEELNEWSRIMNNCIANYAQKAKKGECLLLGVRKGNNLAYNLEITPQGRLKQFLAKSNSKAFLEDQKTIESILSKNHILK